MTAGAAHPAQMDIAWDVAGLAVGVVLVACMAVGGGHVLAVLFGG